MKIGKEKQPAMSERALRFGRNFNIGVGGVACAAALAIPGPNILISSYAALQFAQAGGFEAVRRWNSNRLARTASK